MQINNTPSSPLSSPPPSSPPPLPAQEPPFSMPDLMVLDETPLPVYLHQQLNGSKCGHFLQPFQSPRTPYCDFCLMTHAHANFKSTFEALQHEVYRANNSGPNQRWNQARHAFFRARIAFNRVMLSIARRNDRKKAWDEAHIRRCQRIQYECKCGKLTTIGITPISDAVCFACASFNSTVNNPDHVDVHVDKSTAWWEHPNALTPAPVPATPRPQRRTRPVLTTGSAFIRDLIRAERANLLEDEDETAHETVQMRIENAYRRKNRLQSSSIPPWFFSRPLNGMHSRQQHLATLIQRRSRARQARGHRLPAPPSESPLRTVESIDEVSSDDSDDSEVAMWVEEGRKMEKATSSVAEEVGYLYFVGCDGEEWKEDYLVSDCSLVRREREPDFGDDMLL